MNDINNNFDMYHFTPVKLNTDLVLNRVLFTSENNNTEIKITLVVQVVQKDLISVVVQETLRDQITLVVQVVQKDLISVVVQ